MTQSTIGSDINFCIGALITWSESTMRIESMTTQIIIRMKIEDITTFQYVTANTCVEPHAVTGVVTS